MGIELAIACVPCAEMTAERIQILHDTVDELPDDELEFDIHTFVSEGHTREEIVELLHYHIEVLRDAEDYWRHVYHIRLPELPYVPLVAGGYTFDESPSDLYDTFSIIEDCLPLLGLLVDWAKEDLQSK